MRIGVVGAGGLGTGSGAALARAGHDVVLLGRRGIERDSVTVEGDYDAPARLTSDAASALATPSSSCSPRRPTTSSGPPRVDPARRPGASRSRTASPGGTSTRRSRRVEAVDPGGALTAAIDPGRAIGCVAYLGAAAARAGPGRHAAARRASCIGEPDRRESPRLQALAEALEGAGFPVRTPPRHPRRDLGPS